ncbi:hypothetical protein D3C72_750150 [compost metagenome]
MPINKIAAGWAAGAALAMVMSAGTAQAGVASITVAPSPSVAGQSVTLSSSNFGSCSGANVEFRDVTGGASKTLCNATVAGGAVSCVTNQLTDTGLRTLQGVVTTPGPCLGVLAIAPSHTVNAAPTAVPTMSEWTLWGLAGLLLIGGGVFASRRFRATAA